MKGTDDRNPGPAGKPEHPDVLEELFRHATARQRPPAADEKEIRDALHEQWRGMTTRRRRRGMALSLAAAASLILAVLVGYRVQQDTGPVAPPVPLATVYKVNGSVFVHSSNNTPAVRAVASGTVFSGQKIVTGLGSRLALHWQDGSSLRIDENTEVELKPDGVVTLVSGQLYVDTGSVQLSAAPLVIMTPAGPVTHLGTQYMTRVSGEETRISVREGRAALLVDGVDIVAAHGEQLVVETSGERSRRPVETWGPLWEWTQSLAPGFELDGRTLSDFLEYIGRESGRTIEYESPVAEQVAAETRLHGSVEIEPVRALDVLLQTTDLVSEIRGGAIVVAVRQ